MVLAGVHEHLLVTLAQQRADGGQLDELRAVSDDRQDLMAVRAASARSEARGEGDGP